MTKMYAWPDGRWETIRLIGQGGNADVYEIRREEFGNVYRAAMKVIRIPRREVETQELLQRGYTKAEIQEEYRARAIRMMEELKIMERLKGYTNIVSYEDHQVLQDTDRIGWTILIRMELLTPMKVWFKEHPFGEEQVLKLGEDLCSALAICHRQKILHRDIKNDNIFVNEQGDFKLGDFGIARMSTDPSAAGEFSGTYTYMAPEVYRKEADNELSDLYSLGMVLYSLMNRGLVPFLPVDHMPTAKDRWQAMICRMSHNEIPEPLYGSEALKKVVLKAISFAPQDRYADAASFKKALKACHERPAVIEDPDQTIRYHYEPSQKVVPLDTEEITQALKEAKSAEPAMETTQIEPGTIKERVWAWILGGSALFGSAAVIGAWAGVLLP